MNTLKLGTSDLEISRLAYGCWRLAPTDEAGQTTGREALIAAYEAGYSLFDHADIYGTGRAETVFGQVLGEVSGMRESVTIATKCGVRKADAPAPGDPMRYDLSAAYISRSCESSLRRLRIETIDLFQLHRPDWLMNPDEVAGAFCRLRDQGKVREFGISNFSASQVTALQSTCPMRLQVHQLEASLIQRSSFTDGTLDQCLAGKMTPLAWSPLAGGLLADGARRLLPSQQGYQATPILKEIDILARRLETSRGIIALAWLLRHPAGIVPVVGSTNPTKIREAVDATYLNLSREEWYRLLEAARGETLP
jgi:predicted oxidoreductase